MQPQHPFKITSFLIALFSLLTLISVAAITAAQPISLPVSGFSRDFSFDQKLVEPSPVVDNRYGLQLDLDGTTLAVSAVHIDTEDQDDPENYVGAVYVYREGPSSVWSLEQSLETPDTVKDDSFGGSVAVQGDWLVVGAPGSPGIGKAHIYKRTGTNWALVTTLTPDSSPTTPAFGTSVAIDGTRLLVGAPGETFATGAVYIYDWNGTSWARTEKLTGPGVAAAFGFSVALDGNTALVGGTLIDGIPMAGNDPGEAYVYFYNGLGWAGQGTLTPTDAANGDRFGFAVDLSGDTALIGAYNNDSATGSAYIYTRSGGSTWSQQAKLLPAEAVAGDRVGWSVDLDGDFAVLGADGRDQTPYTDLGAVYIFERDGITWTQIQKILPPENATDTEFGGAVDLEGQILIVGAPDKQNDEGAVYTFSDPVLVTNTPVPSTSTSVPSTATPAPGTATSQPPTPTGTQVVALPLVLNGGFEEANPLDSKQARYWVPKNAEDDKRKCKADKAHSGECYYQFKGGEGEQSKLTQQLDSSSYALATGYQMYASGFYFAKGEVNAKIKVIAKMADDTKEKIKLNFQTPTTGWQPFTGYTPLSAAPVELKFMIINKSLSGKIRFDDLALCNCCCPSPLRITDRIDLQRLP
jgi:hypothetical protein